MTITNDIEELKTAMAELNRAKYRTHTALAKILGRLGPTLAREVLDAADLSLELEDGVFTARSMEWAGYHD